MYLTITASKLLQRSIVTTTRRNREQKSICYYRLAYSNWNLWATDLIHSEDLLSSGENQLLSIKEAFFPRRTYVYCHISLIYISSTPLVFWGGVLRCQIDCSVSPRESGVGRLEMKSCSMRNKLRPMLTCRLHCYRVWGLVKLKESITHFHKYESHPLRLWHFLQKVQQ